MSNEKGKPRKGGRKPGQKNKYTKGIKEEILTVFKELQTSRKYKNVSLRQIAVNNPIKFYDWCVRICPQEMSAFINNNDLFKIYEGVDKSKM